jgi:hypothetical protein
MSAVIAVVAIVISVAALREPPCTVAALKGPPYICTYEKKAGPNAAGAIGLRVYG